jgi:hypothetical protein
MTVQRFYRAAVWLPLAVPLPVVIAFDGFGWSPGDRVLNVVVQPLLMSFVYGGVPYAAAAIWAMRWIEGHRSEPDIRRLALRAPFIVLAVWVGFSTLLLFARGVSAIALLSALGGAYILVLGYIYIAVVFVLRRALARTGRITH